MLDLANESFALGENLLDTKLARNFFRSLPSHFNMKVTAIKEVNNITTMKHYKLFGSIRMFELSLDDNLFQKKSRISFQGVGDDISKSNKKQP